MAMTVTREEVLAFRVRAQQLDQDFGTIAAASVLDIGVQDTGPDAGRWALALRGIDVTALRTAGSVLNSALSVAWTVRGAPHLYRRTDLPWIAAVTAPYSDNDAGKRIYDAAKPLKAAGISNLQALRSIAGEMRRIVIAPMVKGELSRELASTMAPPYLRFCRPCNASHLYEMPFRQAALPAGLELRAGTSPPVLQPIPGFSASAEAPERFDLIRCYLRLLGPATPQQVAAYLDAPVQEVKARWPQDAVETLLEDKSHWMLAEDLPKIGGGPATAVRLLGGFDLFVQTKERTLLVADPKQAKVLWPVLGRPGAVLVDGEIAGTWRPRKAGSKLTVLIGLWAPLDAKKRAAVQSEAEKLAAFRHSSLAAVKFE